MTFDNGQAAESDDYAFVVISYSEDAVNTDFTFSSSLEFAAGALEGLEKNGTSFNVSADEINLKKLEESTFIATLYENKTEDGESAFTYTAKVYFSGKDACLALFVINAAANSQVIEKMRRIEDSVAVEQLETEEETAPVVLESIDAEYYGDTEAGTTINNKSDIEVEAIYSDGTSELVNGWKVKKAKKLKAGKTTKVTVVYKKKKTVIKIKGDIPVEYENALYKAQSYSDSMYMSKQGIYDQLVSEYGEGFDDDAASYAVEHVDANWKRNALEKAKSYQDSMHMSKSAIYDQLVSAYGEQFTAEQAQYAVDNL